MPTLSRPSSSRGHDVLHSPRKKVFSHLNVESANASPDASTSSLPSAGLRAQLHHLLPKHALFHVCVQIHEIANIPLVSGEFGVRWKFKNTTSHGTGSSRSLFGFTKREKGKGRELSSLAPNGHDIPSVIVSGNSSTNSSSSLSSLAYPLGETYTHASTSTTSLAEPEAPVASSSSDPSMLYPCQHPMSSPSTARGMTSYLPLQEHGVAWSHVLHTTVKMSVSREDEHLLAPCPFKLVVRQRVIAGDPDAPQNPRLGAVYLDLAEYAGVEGETTRRYLLRESKTNATLKLTISLHHVGGDKDYRAPPLPKGEILNGIAGFLDSEIYRNSHRLDLFASRNHTPEDSDESDVEEESLDSRRSTRKRVPFEVSQLPYAYGPRTTESLIEAIFNPVPVPATPGVEEPESNPFVFYVREGEGQDTARDRSRGGWLPDEGETVSIRTSTSNWSDSGSGGSSHAPPMSPVASVSSHFQRAGSSLGMSFGMRSRRPNPRRDQVPEPVVGIVN